MEDNLVKATESTKAMMNIMNQTIKNNGDNLIVEPKLSELINAEEVVSREDVQHYKETFKNTIIGRCKAYNHDLYDEKDLINFKKIAQAELDAHIENVGLSELDFDSPEDDAHECMSYWD